ncbi:MAG: ComEC/Rec2 family competence protein [Phycisphaerales bacterium]|jgi:ComEC/Rec2-related protein|nr:ComEC/Rec2 family competence protein [Phycisphaerales bacterium]
MPLVQRSGVAPGARARAAIALGALVIGYAAGLSAGVPALAWAIGAGACAAAALAATWRGSRGLDAENSTDRPGPPGHPEHDRPHAPSQIEPARKSNRGTPFVRHSLLIGALAMLAAAWCVWRVVDPPLPAFVRAIDAMGDAPRVMIEGVVLDHPRQAPASLDPLERFRRRGAMGTCSVSLRAVQVNADTSDWRAARVMTPARGIVRVSVPGSTFSGASGLGGFPCKAGDRVRLVGAFHPIAPPMNPGEDRWAADPQLLANQDSRVGSMVVPDASLATLVVHQGSVDRAMAPLRRALADVRARALSILDPGPGDTPGESLAARADGSSAGPTTHQVIEDRAMSRAFLLSLLLGEDPSGEREVAAMFTRAGLSHVLAISGVHVAVVVAVGLFLLRAVREPGRIEPLIAALLVLAYLILVPAEAPVVRSGVLAIVLTLARFAGRRYDALPLLLWASVALAIWRPLDVWSLGYQLSVGLSALLVWRSAEFGDRLFMPRIRGVVDERPWQVRLTAGAARGMLATTLLCAIVSLPLIWWHTGRVSLAAIPAALVVLPLVALLMHAGYAILIAGFVMVIATLGIGGGASGAAEGLGAALLPLSHWCVRATAWFEGLPGASVSIAAPSAAWAIAATLTALWMLLAARWRSARTWTALVMVVAWGAAGSVIARGGTGGWGGEKGIENTRSDRWSVQTLALREGVCTIVKLDGRSVLFNAGAGEAWSGARTIERAMVGTGTECAEFVILARPDLEHAGAVHALWRQGRVESWTPSDLCQRSMKEETTPLPTLVRTMGIASGIDGCDPLAWEQLGDGAAVRFTFGGTRVLLATGLTRPELRALLDSNADLGAEVLQLPHALGVWRECKELVKRSGAKAVVQTDPAHVARDPEWNSAKEGRAWIATALDGGALVRRDDDGELKAEGFSASRPRTRGSRPPDAGP